MDPGIIFFLLIGTSIGIGVTYYNYSMIRASYRGLFGIIQSPQMQGIFSPVLIGRFIDRSIRIEAQPGGRNAPPSVTMILYASTTFNMTLYSEGFWQKMAKKAGFLEEMEIGSADFDDRYVILAGDRHMVEAYLHKKDIRDIIDALFSLGFTKLEVLSGAVKLEKTNADLSVDLDYMRIRLILNKIIDLVEGF
jgi:hypothetical protein